MKGKPLLTAINRKLFTAVQGLKDRTIPTDEEYNEINNKFEKQEREFKEVMVSIKAHLEQCQQQKPTLLNIGNSVLNLFEPENDVYNFVLQNHEDG